MVAIAVVLAILGIIHFTLLLYSPANQRNSGRFHGLFTVKLTDTNNKRLFSHRRVHLDQAGSFEGTPTLTSPTFGGYKNGLKHSANSTAQAGHIMEDEVRTGLPPTVTNVLKWGALALAAGGAVISFWSDFFPDWLWQSAEQVFTAAGWKPPTTAVIELEKMHETFIRAWPMKLTRFLVGTGWTGLVGVLVLWIWRGGHGRRVSRHGRLIEIVWEVEDELTAFYDEVKKAIVPPGRGRWDNERIMLLGQADAYAKLSTTKLYSALTSFQDNSSILEPTIKKLNETFQEIRDRLRNKAALGDETLKCARDSLHGLIELIREKRKSLEILHKR